MKIIMCLFLSLCLAGMDSIAMAAEKIDALYKNNFTDKQLEVLREISAVAAATYNGEKIFVGHEDTEYQYEVNANDIYHYLVKKNVNISVKEYNDALSLLKPRIYEWQNRRNYHHFADGSVKAITPKEQGIKKPSLMDYFEQIVGLDRDIIPNKIVKKVPLSRHYY